MTDTTSTATSKFTVFCRQADNRATTFIDCVEAADLEVAKAAALNACAQAWDYPNTDDIVVVGVAEGDVNILEWQDQDA